MAGIGGIVASDAKTVRVLAQSQNRAHFRPDLHARLHEHGAARLRDMVEARHGEDLPRLGVEEPVLGDVVVSPWSPTTVSASHPKSDERNRWVALNPVTTRRSNCSNWSPWTGSSR